MNHAGRLDALRSAIDAPLLVTHPSNLRYLTGFAGSSGYLLVLPSGPATFVTDGRYGELAEPLREFTVAGELLARSKFVYVTCDSSLRPWPVPSVVDFCGARATSPLEPTPAPARLSMALAGASACAAADGALSAERELSRGAPLIASSPPDGNGDSERGRGHGRTGGGGSMRTGGSYFLRNIATPITPTLVGRPVRAA